MNFASSAIRTAAVLAAILLSPGCWTAAAWAQSPTVEIVDAQVGLGGLYKVGVWTPVTVKLKGGKLPATGELRLIAPDGDDLPSRISSPKPYLAAPGETTSAMLYVKFGRVESELTVVFLDPKTGEVFARRTFDSQREPSEGGLRWGMFSAQELIVSVGASIGVEDAIRLQRRDSRESIELARLQSVEQLPTRWYGYEGVNAVILSTSQPEIYRRLTAAGEQLAALDEWVQRGGKLIITAGSQAPEVVANGPLARFAPGTFVRPASLPQAADLEAYADVNEPLPLPRIGETRLPVAQFSNVRGLVEAPDNSRADLPLVIRTPYGFGEVVFVTVDLDRAPFIDWTARKNFTSKLLGYPARGGEEQPERKPGDVASTGLSDLSGQLRGALDQFAGVKLVPFFVVASLVFVYILLIGPGDYFLVRNVLKRMEWTWITFPLIVAAVSIGAYVLATVLKGKQLRLNQVDLVDVCLDEDKPLVRGTSWMNVFSPRTDAYDLRFSPHPSGEESESTEVLFSWLGLPGSALGGMEERTRNARLTDRPYDFSRDLTRLEDLPIHVWSTKSLTARWSMPDPGLLLDAEDIRVEDADVLKGKITSKLEVKLTDCWLAHDRWVYPLESFSPGQTIDLDPLWKDREVLASRLTRNRVEKDTTKNQFVSVSSPYDPASFDVPMILRQMMFYGASGGQNYAGLLHRFQSYIDMSGHLDLDRCILIGFCEEAAGSLERLRGEEWETIRGPEDRHWTCYRFVIPVSRKP